MCVPLAEEREVPSRGRFGAVPGRRTVTGMNTLNTVMSVVASHGEHDHYWFPFGFLWLFLLAAVLFFVFRGRRWHHVSGADRARDILAERYARGEITGEEYRERLEQLR